MHTPFPTSVRVAPRRGGRGTLHRVACAAVLVALASTLAACGGSSPSSNASGEQAREQQAETKFADFAKCMREHGINAETVSGPGGGHDLKISPGRAGGSPATFEAAQKACQKYRPEPKRINLSPQQKVEREEAVQKFARCMREHGIKVEAQTSGGAIRIGIHAHSGPGGGGEPNPESPAFQQAQSACQKLLPAPPGGGKGLPVPSRRPSSGSEKGSGSGNQSGLALSGGG